ncbi:MAG: uroporphyrinogen-III synthase, partial [Chloroflexota bacterium]|nr:uroporphyrinogen-III synthase [Chloroflexota bacterium]
ELPAIDIQPVADTAELDSAISNLKHYHWIIFTSVNGVAAFFARLHSLKRDARALHGLKIGAIGPATVRALEEKGVTPDYCPAVYTSEGIIAGLKKANIKGQRFLLPRTDIADKELTKGLTHLGAEVHEVTVYQTVPALEAVSRARELLESGKIDLITFTSSSTVSNLMAALGDGEVAINGVKIACIGPKTAATAAGAGLKVDIVAGESTIPGLVTAIEEYFRKEA